MKTTFTIGSGILSGTVGTSVGIAAGNVLWGLAAFAFSMLLVLCTMAICNARGK